MQVVDLLSYTYEFYEIHDDALFTLRVGNKYLSKDINCDRIGKFWKTLNICGKSKL